MKVGKVIFLCTIESLFLHFFHWTIFSFPKFAFLISEILPVRNYGLFSLDHFFLHKFAFLISEILPIRNYGQKTAVFKKVDFFVFWQFHRFKKAILGRKNALAAFSFEF